VFNKYETKEAIASGLAELKDEEVIELVIAWAEEADQTGELIVWLEDKEDAKNREAMGHTD
jgi:hypothetical protein